MTVTAMEILGSGGGKSPILPLDVPWDTGVALYCAHRWPVGRRKAVALEWSLSAEEARSVVEGVASKRTLEKIWKHKRGGWAVALPVMGAVIGQPIHDFFREQMLQAAREAEHAQHHEQLAAAAYRRLARDTAGPGEGRTQGSRAGTVGAEASRGVAGGAF